MSEETTWNVGRLTEKEWLKNLPTEVREGVLRSMKRPLPDVRYLLKWDDTKVRAIALRLAGEVYGLRLDWEYSRQEARQLTTLLRQSGRRERSLRARLARVERWRRARTERYATKGPLGRTSDRLHARDSPKG